MTERPLDYALRYAAAVREHGQAAVDADPRLVGFADPDADEKAHARGRRDMQREGSRSRFQRTDPVAYQQCRDAGRI